jgi:2-methylcitrate dehydratase PrpD
VIELRNKHRLAPKDIAKVRIATYQGGLDVVNNYEPEGDYQAKFSLPYTVAHALIHGSVRIDAFGPDRLNDPQLRALMGKVELAADAEMSRNFPRQRAARVEIETMDGRKLSHLQETRKGDPELPLSDEELNDKFIELAAPVLGTAGASALLKDLWALEKRKNVEFDHGGRAPARVAL